MTTAFRVLGIDASLRGTGLGVVEARGSRLAGIAHRTLKISAGVRRSECLRQVHEGVRGLIQETTPGAVALESGFFHRNAKTADILGQVRGAVIAACAGAGVPVFEYAPRRVKQAVAGFGGAEKAQVVAMVTRLLALNAEPGEDEADALALAICHLHARTGHAALDAEPV